MSQSTHTANFCTKKWWMIAHSQIGYIHVSKRAKMDNLNPTEEFSPPSSADHLRLDQFVRRVAADQGFHPGLLLRPKPPPDRLTHLVSPGPTWCHLVPLGVIGLHHTPNPPLSPSTRCLHRHLMSLEVHQTPNPPGVFVTIFTTHTY